LPDTTYKELEEAFRASNFSVYLIAIVSHSMISLEQELLSKLPMDK
jgi:hypothetical protein